MLELLEVMLCHFGRFLGQVDPTWPTSQLWCESWRQLAHICPKRNPAWQIQPNDSDHCSYPITIQYTAGRRQVRQHVYDKCELQSPFVAGGEKSWNI